MLTHTPTEASRLRARRKNYHLRVEIQNAAGAWVDYSNAYGRNWLRSVKWDDSIERRVMQGSVTLMREDRAADISLAPTIVGSAANSGGAGILEGRKLKISGAVTPPGILPDVADWHELLYGEIDDVEYGKKSPNMVVGFRDIGARVLDCFITAERVYGTSAGVPVDTVMQAIIDDNWNVGASGPAPVLYVPTPLDASFAAQTYKQAQKSVLEALNDLAQQFGMVVRYKYDALGVFRLTLYDPQRTKTVPDAAFARAEYVELSTLRRSRDDVRNQVLVIYRDVAGVLQSYYEEDAASIAAYGPRFMQFGLNLASQIRTAPKAQAFAQAALSDLSTPLSTHRVESPLYWPVELGDLYTYALNNRQYDNDQDLAVVGWSHEWTAAGKARTTVDTSGRVKGAVKQWINKGGPIALDYFAPTLSARIDYPAQNPPVGDVYVTVDNNGNEQIGVKVTDEAVTDIAVLCVSAVDPTPRFVDKGTEIGPTDWFFVPGTGQVQRLNDILLQDIVVTTLFVRAYGATSYLESPWLAVYVKPWPRPQISAVIVASTPKKLGFAYVSQLTLVITAGVGTKSVNWEVSTDINFAPANIAYAGTDNLLAGNSVKHEFPSVSTTDTVVWYARIIGGAMPLPWNFIQQISLPLIVSTNMDLPLASAEDLDTTNTNLANTQTQLTSALGAQVLVSAATSDFTAERVVADTSTVAWDFGTGGVATAYVPNLGIGTAQLGTGAVTTAKIADEAVTPAKAQRGATTPDGTKFWRGDGTWQVPSGGTTGTTGPIAVYQDVTKVSGTLADGASATLFLDIAPSVAFQHVLVSAAAWVRIYDSMAALIADAGRSFATDPTLGSTGQPIFEVAPGLAGSALTTLLVDNIVAHNADAPRIGRFYMVVTNKSGGAAAITTTVRYLPLEGTPTAIPPDVTAGGLLLRFNVLTLTPVADGTEILSVPNGGSLGGNWGNSSGFGSGPRYKLARINGHPAINCSSIGGNTRPYGVPAWPGVDPTEAHIFLVAKPVDSSPVFSFGGDNTNPTKLSAASGSNHTDPSVSTTNHTYTPGVDPSGGLLYHFHGKAGLFEAFVGLALRYTTAANTVAYAQRILGGYFFGGFSTDMFNGDIGEFRLYSGALTDDEQLGINLQMSSDWGISL